MSFRVYLDLKKLPTGYRVGPTPINHGMHLHNGEVNLGFMNGGYGRLYFESYSPGMTPSIPEALTPAICWVSAMEQISDPEHAKILEPGQYYSTGAQGLVTRDAPRSKSDKYLLTVTVEGKSIDTVKKLLDTILRGRQADEPYYKITSFKRWLKVRFRRFFRNWEDMNVEMRGEAS